MKKAITIVLALLLTGCAHNQSWVVPALAGAVVGAAISSSANQPPRHHHQPPSYYYMPPQRVRQCYSVPRYDYYGRYSGARVECH